MSLETTRPMSAIIGPSRRISTSFRQSSLSSDSVETRAKIVDINRSYQDPLTLKMRIVYTGYNTVKKLTGHCRAIFYLRQILKIAFITPRITCML